MGCDIHIVLEYKRAGQSKWIGEYCSDNYNAVGRNLIARERDYRFFGRLAHVRHRPEEGPRHYPQNLPRDVSDLAWDQYMRCPTDYHSPSHLSVSDFCAAYLADNPNDTRVRPEYAAYDLLGITDDEDCEYRVVFWFDN